MATSAASKQLWWPGREILSDKEYRLCVEINSIYYSAVHFDPISYRIECDTVRHSIINFHAIVYTRIDDTIGYAFISFYSIRDWIENNPISILRVDTTECHICIPSPSERRHADKLSED